MSYVTLEKTIDLEYNDMSAEVDISVTFKVVSTERPVRDYPGHPGTVELISWSIQTYWLFDENGDHIEEGPLAHTPLWLEQEVDEWITDNDLELIAEACQAEADEDEVY